MDDNEKPKKKSISVKSRKAKGRLFQQEIAQRISDLTDIKCGKDELIRSREGGQSGTDIVILGEAFDKIPLSIEVKRQEKLSIPTWIKQAKSNQIEGTIWVLFCKRNNEDPFTVIDSETFFKMCKSISENNNWFDIV